MKEGIVVENKRVERRGAKRANAAVKAGSESRKRKVKKGAADRRLLGGERLRSEDEEEEKQNEHGR